MNAFVLTGKTPTGKDAEVWGCGECLRTCLDEEHAKSCCAPYQCKHCGAECKRYWTICEACRQKQWQERLDKEFAEATVVSAADYDYDYVCFGDNHFVDFHDWLSDLEAGDTDVAWAWACVPEGVPVLDAERILEGSLDDMHEEAIEDLDVEALQEALDDWHAAQKVTWYRVDKSRRIVADGTVRLRDAVAQPPGVEV